MNRAITVRTEASHLKVVDGLIDIPCLNCRTPLELHQPVPKAPHRLLGVCVACGSWHAIITEAAEAVVVQLPDPGDLFSLAMSAPDGPVV
jgi:hypothetical protein